MYLAAPQHISGFFFIQEELEYRVFCHVLK
jgi:hypothetical protein